jgi:hypothetical protein
MKIHLLQLIEALHLQAVHFLPGMTVFVLEQSVGQRRIIVEKVVLLRVED